MEQLKIYIWESEYFCNYSRGQIITAAMDLETAKEQALTKYDLTLKRSSNDPEYQEFLDKRRQEFLDDLNKAPNVLAITDTIFIWGSD